MNYSLAAIVTTTPFYGTPHNECLANHNIGVPIFTADLGGNGWTAFGVRNCDATFREWWRRNREKITADVVVILEWDVRCEARLADVIRDPSLVIGPSLVYEKTPWPPWGELDRFPDFLRPHVVAFQPMCMVSCPRAALDAILSPIYDNAFAADVLCEFRFPTVMAHAGFKLDQFMWAHSQNEMGVTGGLRRPHGSPGEYPLCGRILHPIKHKID